jgi:hypothetical protein
VPLAADPVEHDARDANGRIVVQEAAHHRRCRLRLPRHVKDKEHRETQAHGEIGGRA